MTTSFAEESAAEAPSGRCAWQGATALVVFVDRCEFAWLRWLRRGFRHCFVLVETPQGWLVCDPLSNRTELACVVGLTAAELIQFYLDAGLRVVKTTVLAAPARLAPVRPFTCVEAVKRVLGIHAPWVLTPWQLYRSLHNAGADKSQCLTGLQT